MISLLSELLLALAFALVAYTLFSTVLEHRELRARIAREALELAQLRRGQAASHLAEVKRAEARKAAYDALAARGAGYFEVFARQSEARPGWAESLSPEQIANFGAPDY